MYLYINTLNEFIYYRGSDFTETLTINSNDDAFVMNANNILNQFK